MSRLLQSEEDAKYASLEEDICSRCERVFKGSRELHQCSVRDVLVAHRRSASTSHTRPVDKNGRLLVMPVQRLLDEEDS